MAFDYTRIKIFEKTGREIPVSYSPAISITIPNKYGDDAIFYVISDPSGTSFESYKKTSGGRFSTSGITPSSNGDFNGDYSDDFLINGSESVKTYNTELDGILETIDGKNSVKVNLTLEDMPSTVPNEGYVKNISIPNEVYSLSENARKFPSAVFSAGIKFERVSTELFETQTLYFLAESAHGNETPSSIVRLDDRIYTKSKYTKLSTLAAFDSECSEFIQRFRIILYIDNRNQTDFRFFSANGNDIEWSGRKSIDFTSSESNSYRADIGFSGKYEGTYHEKIYVCLEDTQQNGETYVIGQISMEAETVGEDERYRTLFTNFGLPHPSEFMNIYKDTDTNEDKIDNVSMNLHSKELFMSYDTIFPYAGSYKALYNAISILGYDDIFFKEWYKTMGDKSGYVSYEMSYGGKNERLSSISIDERMSLKKTNWISMMYKINSETVPYSYDKYMFMDVEEYSSYKTTESLIKLSYLKTWLEKYILPIHCRIIDIGAEGIYMERYRSIGYGTYQRVIDYSGSKNIAPYFVETYPNEESFEEYPIRICVSSYNQTIETFSNTRISDMCNGYFDSSFVYHDMITDSYDSSCISGMTIGYPTLSKHYKFRLSTTSDNFSFGYGMITQRSSRMIISGNTIRLYGEDIDEKGLNCAFKNPPFIQISSGTIRNPYNHGTSGILYEISENQNLEYKSYIVKDLSTGIEYAYDDMFTLSAPKYVDEDDEKTVIKDINGTVINCPIYNGTDSSYRTSIETRGLRYTGYGITQGYAFIMRGYQSNIIGDSIVLDTSKDFIIDISSGRMVFDDSENGRTVLIIFSLDNETGKTSVYVKISYMSEEYDSTRYAISSQNRICDFRNGYSYPGFVERYMENPETAISIQNEFDVSVKTPGKYSCDVFGYDIENEYYCAPCINSGFAACSEPEIFAISNIESESEYTETDHMKEKYCYGSRCGLRNKYDTISFTRNSSEKESIIENGNRLSIIPNSESKYAEVSNICNSFRIVSMRYGSGDTSLSENGLSEYILELEKENVSNPKWLSDWTRGDVIERLNETHISDPCEFLKELDQDSNRELNANAIIYDNVANIPICQFPCVFMNLKAFSSSEENKNRYLVYISDNIRRYYAWYNDQNIYENHMRFGNRNVLCYEDDDGNLVYVRTETDFDQQSTMELPSMAVPFASDISEFISYLKRKSVSMLITPEWQEEMSLESVFDSYFKLKYSHPDMYRVIAPGKYIRIALMDQNGYIETESAYKVKRSISSSNDRYIELYGEITIYDGYSIYLSPLRTSLEEYETEIESLTKTDRNELISCTSDDMTLDSISKDGGDMIVTMSDIKTSECQSMWMDSSYIRETGIYFPTIMDSNIYLHDMPFETNSSFTKTAFETNYSNKEYMIHWDMIDSENSKKISHDGNILFTDITTPGIYGIEVTVYDKYGTPHVSKSVNGYKIAE